MAARAQGLHDLGQREAAFDIQVGQVVMGDHALRRVGLGVLSQRVVGVAQLALDQLLRHRRRLRPSRRRRRASPANRTAVRICAGVRPLRAASRADEGVGHRDAFERLAHQAFARARWRRLELQVVGKTAPERRVDLLDAVGDPDRRHVVGLQDLVDPGLAADAAVAGRRHLLGARQQLRGFAGDRREHVLDLVEQQGGVLAALEEDLGDLQRAVAVAAAERVAVAVGVFDLEQLQPGRLRHHLGQFGLAGAGRAVQQDVDARLLARHRIAEQGAQHLGVFAAQTRSRRSPALLLLDGRVNTAISSARSRYSRISTGGSFSLTFIRSARSVMLCSEIRFSTRPMRSSREPARSASPTSLALTWASSAMAA